MRLDQLIQDHETKKQQTPEIHFTIIESREQLQHRDRFSKVPSDDITDSALNADFYHLERKQADT